jgi:hypothetical protein
MGKVKEALSEMFDGDSTAAACCAVFQFPAYLTGIELLSQNGLTIYDTLAIKVMGAFCLFSGACSSFVTGYSIREGYQRFKKYRKAGKPAIILNKEQDYKLYE